MFDRFPSLAGVMAPNNTEVMMNQLVRHIEEVQASESAARSVASITDAMFGGVKMRQPTREEKLFAAKHHATQTQKLLAELKDEYKDARGNLQEGNYLLSQALTNIEGHEQDLAEGFES